MNNNKTKSYLSLKGQCNLNGSGRTLIVLREYGSRSKTDRRVCSYNNDVLERRTLRGKQSRKEERYGHFMVEHLQMNMGKNERQ